MKRVSLIVVSLLLLAGTNAIYACNEKHTEDTIPEKTKKYRLASEGEQSPLPFEIIGFADAEQKLRWTSEKEVSIKLPLFSEQGQIKIVKFLNASALISPTHSQEVQVFMNDRFQKIYNFDMDSPSQDIQVVFPQDLTGEAIVKLLLPNACSPESLYPGSGDLRSLGIWMNLVEVTYEAQKQNNSNLEKTLQYRLASEGEQSPFPFEIIGFADAEQKLRWTSEKEVSIKLPLFSEQGQIKIVKFLNASALISPTHSQEVQVFMNDRFQKIYNFDMDSPSQDIQVVFPQDLTGEAIVKLLLPNACSPESLYPGSGDLRSLGIWMNLAEVTYGMPSNETITRYHFGQHDDTLPFKIVSGFSGGEGSLRWTSKKKAELEIDLIKDETRISRIRFLDTAALISAEYGQQLDVSVNGMNSRYFYSLVCPSNTVEINFPPKLRKAVINFGMPMACQVCKFDPNNLDPRKLAIAFKDVEITYVPNTQLIEVETVAPVQHRVYRNRKLPEIPKKTIVNNQDQNQIIQDEPVGGKRRRPAQKLADKKQKKDYDIFYQIELAKLIPDSFRDKELTLINNMVLIADETLLNIPKINENRLGDIAKFVKNTDDLGHFTKNNKRSALRKLYDEYTKLQDVLDEYRKKAQSAVEVIKAKDAAIEKTHSRVNLALKNKTNTDMTVNDALQSFLSEGKLKKVESTPKTIKSTVDRLKESLEITTLIIKQNSDKDMDFEQDFDDD